MRRNGTTRRHSEFCFSRRHPCRNVFCRFFTSSRHRHGAINRSKGNFGAFGCFHCFCFTLCIYIFLPGCGNRQDDDTEFETAAMSVLQKCMKNATTTHDGKKQSCRAVCACRLPVFLPLGKNKANPNQHREKTDSDVPLVKVVATHVRCKQFVSFFLLLLCSNSCFALFGKIPSQGYTHIVVLVVLETALWSYRQ
jgi:hypothetical protein